MLDTEDPANRRVVDYLARHDQRGEPPDEPAYYPPLERLTTHPDVLEHVWQDRGSNPSRGVRTFRPGVPGLVHDRTGIILAFALGTADADWLFGKWAGQEEPGWASTAYRAFDQA